MSDEIIKYDMDQLTGLLSDKIALFTEVEKVGTMHKAICPFHGEKQPSLIIDDGNELFNCIGCGFKGDISTFLTEYKKQWPDDYAVQMGYAKYV